MSTEFERFETLCDSLEIPVMVDDPDYPNANSVGIAGIIFLFDRDDGEFKWIGRHKRGSEDVMLAERLSLDLPGPPPILRLVT